MEPLRTTVVNIRLGHIGDVYIGRKGHDEDGYFGNPAVSNNKSEGLRRVEALRGYLRYFRHRMGLVWNVYWSNAKQQFNDDEFKKRVALLRGKRLGCFCAPSLCHGHVIAAWLNDGPIGLAKFEQALDKLEAQL